MKLDAMGEDAVVTALVRKLAQGERVLVGPGDDCAVIGGKRDARWMLLKTDCTVEGVHFLPDEKPGRVGWKAMCRTISDIAAMGGVPQHALVTLAVRPDVDFARVRGVFEGLKRAAGKHGVTIVGGETSRSLGGMFINVALTGWVERGRCVLRSGGKAGDALYVTGKLGGSIAGKHLDFQPRLAEARWLTEHFAIRAMMDLSDGLGGDLPRLATASGCGFTLDEEAIPVTRGCTREQAIRDGEDYELLFAIRGRDAAALEKSWKVRFPRLALTRIGALTDVQRPSNASNRGFDHFAQP